MWRFILPGFVIVGTLLLLLSGGLGLWHATSPRSAVATHPIVASVAPPKPAAPQPPPVQPQTLQQAAAPDPLQARADALQAQIEHRTQQLASLHARTDQAKQQLGAIQQQQQSVAASVVDQRKDLASLQDQTKGAQQQLDSLQKQEESADTSAKKHNDELAALRAQTDQARQALAGMQQQQHENAAATQQLAALHAQIAQANREIASLKQQRQAEAQSLTKPKSQPDRAVASVPARQPPPQLGAATALASRSGSGESPAPASAGPAPAPAGPAQSQLESARQQLAQGRPWIARRLLSMAQTQLAFQPVTPDQPTAQGGNVAATWVGEAIHWIDLGDTGQAYQAINRAIQLTPRAVGSSYADSTNDRSAYPPGYDQRYYQQH